MSCKYLSKKQGIGFDRKNRMTFGLGLVETWNSF